LAEGKAPERRSGSMNAWWSAVLVVAAVVLAGLWGVACRDDQPDGDGDGDVDADSDGDGDLDADSDGDVDADSDGDGDVDGDADGDVERIPCPDVVLCVDECNADDDCAIQCAAHVCGPAGEELAALLTCTANHCGAAVCTDRQSTECQNCILQNCPAQTLDCYTSSCVRGEQSCGEVSICLAGCGTDTSCADTCTGSICPAGADELEGMMSCLDGSCGDQCTNLSAPSCGTCLQEHCSGPVNTCVWAPCT